MVCPLLNIENGKVLCSVPFFRSGYVVGTWASFSCGDSFLLNRPSSVICQNSLNWSEQSPTCRPSKYNKKYYSINSAILHLSLVNYMERHILSPLSNNFGVDTRFLLISGGDTSYEVTSAADRIKLLPVAFLVNTWTYQLPLRLVFTSYLGEYESQCQLICPRIHLKCHW